jgi:hypothetical protein
MKNAWTHNRTYGGTFANSLRNAWASAKGIGHTGVNNLLPGDTIRIPTLPGIASMFTTKTVASIKADELGWAGPNVTFTDGTVRCFAAYDVVPRSAKKSA